jgi:hypothetical protein
MCMHYKIRATQQAICLDKRSSEKSTVCSSRYWRLFDFVLNIHYSLFISFKSHFNFTFKLSHKTMKTYKSMKTLVCCYRFLISAYNKWISSYVSIFVILLAGALSFLCSYTQYVCT